MSRMPFYTKEYRYSLITLLICCFSVACDYFAGVLSRHFGIIDLTIILFVISNLFGALMHLLTRNRHIPYVIPKEEQSSGVLDAPIEEKTSSSASSMISYYAIYIASCILALKLFNILT